MGKVRIQELARKMAIPVHDLRRKLEALGVEIGEQGMVDSGAVRRMLRGRSRPAGPEEVSHDEMVALYDQAMRQMSEGDVVAGEVIKITDGEVVIDVGFLFEGRIPTAEFADHRGGLTVAVGEQVDVLLEKIDHVEGHLRLSKPKAEQTGEDPWLRVGEKYPLGARVRGRVVGLFDSGARVELEPGVEGLVPTHLMSSDESVVSPTELVDIGDVVETIVFDHDPAARQIELSLRHAVDTAAPVDGALEERHGRRPGEVVAGRIFLSYSRLDREKARRFKDAFTGMGWSVFWDEEVLAGTEWDAMIQQELDAAECVVVLWSAESATRSWVREESHEGMQRQILVPVLIEEVEPPLGFRRLQAEDMVGWEGDRDDERFRRLCKAVGRVIDRLRAEQGPE